MFIDDEMILAYYNFIGFYLDFYASLFFGFRAWLIF